MSVRTAAAPKTVAKAQRELEDLQLVLKARNGDGVALDALIRRYNTFVRLKASSYFLAGGDSDDLIQEGLIGLYKAVRDFRAATARTSRYREIGPGLGVESPPWSGATRASFWEFARTGRPARCSSSSASILWISAFSWASDTEAACP